MGKKRSAARRAAATAAPALAPTASPAVPFDTHDAVVDTPPASTVRESPTNTQQPRVSHEADATRAPRAASPAQPTIDTTLIREPAASDARADTSVAIATPQALVAHAFEPCPEPDHSPPALTTPTSTSNDVPAVSAQRTHIHQHADIIHAAHTPFPALSALAAAAVADLATVIERAGPPTVFLACPTHVFCRAEDFSHESETLAPRMRPATTREEIDEDLLENIIEDAQRLTRIEVRREVRLKALEVDRERAWKEGLEEGKRLARKEARAEAQQRERAWKDGYEMGRCDGYHEGLEVVRTEVSTPSSIDASVQADVSTPPHSPSADTVPAPARVDTGIQFDTPPLPSPSRANSPPLTPVDTTTATPHVNADVQTEDLAPTLSLPIYACTTTPRVDAGVQFDAVPTTSRVPADVQSDDLTPTFSPSTDTRATSHIDTGIQAEDPTPAVTPLSPPDDTHSPYPRVQVSTQTDVPRTSAPACARTVQEIEVNLLADILAKASAKGEAKGFTKGKHIGFQDGMEAGWKSGTREGHGEGYCEGKKDGIKEGCEQFRLEVSRIPRAVAVVQTDCIPFPTHIDSTTQTTPTTGIRHATPTTIATNVRPCTFISTSCDDNRMSHVSSTTPNNVSMSHNATSFSWADEASSLPISCTAPLIAPPPRDFSILRSSSARPFDSLKRRARRSQARPTRPSHSSRQFIPISEPIVTRRHPAGLRADRPSVVTSPSPSVPNLVKLEAPPLDWQGDPRLQELGRVLRGLGWVRVSGS